MNKKVHTDTNNIEWIFFLKKVNYKETRALLFKRWKQVAQNQAREMIIVFETDRLYTRGSCACDMDFEGLDGIPVVDEPRGGGYTYYGPGIFLVNVILHLKKRKMNLHAFNEKLEQWMLLSAQKLGVNGALIGPKERPGIWVKVPPKRVVGSFFVDEEKIAAYGFCVKNWVTYEGFSFYITPNFNDFSGISPCSLHHAYSMTSLEKLKLSTNKIAVYKAIRRAFREVFFPSLPLR